MKQLPTGGIIGKVQRGLQFVHKLQIPLHAANASYFIVLAVFPALVLLLSILRYTHLDVYSLLDLISGIFPSALVPTVERAVLSMYNNSSTAMVSVSAITALWSASKGVHGILTGLYAIYDVPEIRNSLFTRLISVLYTFAFILVLVLTLVLHVFGTTILGWLQESEQPILRFLTDVIDLRFFLLLFLQTAMFTAMFMAIPSRFNSFGNSLPGALLVSIGWQVFSYAFTLYVENFAGSAGLYGPVYTLAMSMLWLYFCMSIMFYGGTLNAMLIKLKKKQKEKESE